MKALLTTMDRKYLADKFAPLHFGQHNAQFRNHWKAGEFGKALGELTGATVTEENVDGLIVVLW